MLQIKNISKSYGTGDAVQHALSDVSLDLRDSEFVSILGPSGSGKTTLLNIIGGLGSYDSGDIVINGVSTKKYKDRDWDNYRNHRIGFVFQSYNLIPHQSVIENVELALTISGISGEERRRRAEAALTEVGLADHMHKKPNQLSGGQMQRVAIARAIVNEPDILLADEPTGALDSVTSVQVIDILKEISSDRLVVMVTHNPELAEKYSSRIIRLADGRITEDSDPFDAAAELRSRNAGRNAGNVQTGRKKNLREKRPREKRAGMSFATALALSFKNLMNKKGRTIMTAFAGSIGIIGIALVLAVSAGVNSYIDEMQETTLKGYPISIERTATDMTAMQNQRQSSDGSVRKKSGRVYSNTSNLENTSGGTTVTNDLKSFKKYLDKKGNKIAAAAENIVYGYDTQYSVWSQSPDGNMVSSSADTEALTSDPSSGSTVQGFGMDSSAISNMLNGTSSGDTNFSEITPGPDGQLISSDVKKNYDVVYGSWPETAGEVVLVLDDQNSISAETLYQLGLISASELQDMSASLREHKKAGGSIGDYKEICGHTFTIIPGTAGYSEGAGMELKISGIIRPVKDADNPSITTAAAYTSKLTDWLIDQTGISRDDPSSIRIYSGSFENREDIVDLIKNYNKDVSSAKQITYTDYAALLTETATHMVNIITWILVALMAISLIVSSIMIAIITHISVIERTREIGILRALGASKRNVSSVFNAETLIIGLIAGVIGIVVVVLLSFPLTTLASNMLDIADIRIFLPMKYAGILVLLSMAITVLSGLVPSRRAAKLDPVAALRTE